MKIVLLEDDDRRRVAMCDRLRERFPQYEIACSDSAAACIRSLELAGDRVLLASLDHDLVFKTAGDGQLIDAGSGQDVAEFLSGRSATFPVLIHTTNDHGGDVMSERLSTQGWRVRRVKPYGDLDWVDEAWFPLARKLIVGAPVAANGDQAG